MGRLKPGVSHFLAAGFQANSSLLGPWTLRSKSEVRADAKCPCVTGARCMAFVDTPAFLTQAEQTGPPARPAGPTGTQAYLASGI